MSRNVSLYDLRNALRAYDAAKEARNLAAFQVTGDWRNRVAAVDALEAAVAEAYALVVRCGAALGEHTERLHRRTEPEAAP